MPTPYRSVTANPFQTVIFKPLKKRVVRAKAPITKQDDALKAVAVSAPSPLVS